MKGMYQVWLSRGDGPEPGPRFRLLGDAFRFIFTHSDGASCAVKTPNGQWYRDGSGRAIFG